MPKAINNADAAQALTRAYALKGKVSLALDEIIVPVTIVDNLAAEGAPIELRPCAGEIIQPAVVGEFSYIGVQTQATFSLAVSTIVVYNNTGGVVTVVLKGFSAANLTAIGLTLASLIALDLPKDVQTVGSQTWFGSNAADIGVVIGRFRVPVNTSFAVPIGGTIYGIDNPARVAFGLMAELANSQMRGTAYCVEVDGV